MSSALLSLEAPNTFKLTRLTWLSALCLLIVRHRQVPEHLHVQWWLNQDPVTSYTCCYKLFFSYLSFKIAFLRPDGVNQNGRRDVEKSRRYSSVKDVRCWWSFQTPNYHVLESPVMYVTCTGSHKPTRGPQGPTTMVVAWRSGGFSNRQGPVSLMTFLS